MKRHKFQKYFYKLFNNPMLEKKTEKVGKRYNLELVNNEKGF